MLTRSEKIICILMFLLCCVILFSALFFQFNSVIEDIRDASTRTAQTALYQDLIRRAGLIFAQKALHRSGLPFNGETHLLNHESGYAAYRLYGENGLAYCKDYFLGSCYHGFILSFIADHGVGAISNILVVCKEKTDFLFKTQCAHALGHGLLVSYGYKDLLKALAVCEHIELVLNCYDGVFMENLWGLHNGTTSPDRWIKKDDPYYPCTDSRLALKWRRGCWTNQASVMYQLFDGDVARVGEMCADVNNRDYRSLCFENLARQIHVVGNGDVNKWLRLCKEIPQEWNNFCMIAIAHAEYAVGGRKLTTQICNVLNLKKECFQTHSPSL